MAMAYQYNVGWSEASFVRCEPQLNGTKFT